MLRALRPFPTRRSSDLGVEAGRLRAFIIAAATLMTASVVAIAGVIGWVGLVIPHIARMLVGPNFERLLPAAMLIGASYLDRKSTRLNSSHVKISYAVFC